MDEICDGLRFTSNFDSGNLAKVEKAIPSFRFYHKDEQFHIIEIAYEFNLWTKPDCAGTQFENDNKTWFYFGVQGDIVNKWIKFNLRNLNKQSKLYNQGMVPMTRIVPGNTGWERIKEKPKFGISEGQFHLTFVHFFNQKYETTYFAFCYPFSYSDCQEMLEKLDRIYSCNLDPFLLSSCNRANRIYYHRELLCYSVCGHRVDLITVSSYRGITSEREPVLKTLFPDKLTSRAYKFLGKRVFFVSSRVHPGETPSSFVFNGFLKFLLSENDSRAIVLRDTYVFKLIPMLNPDGVVAGYYRTNCCGINLNRMYMNPIKEDCPSIYAAKCLILYHHFSSRIVKQNEDTNVARVCKEEIQQLLDKLEVKPSPSITDISMANEKSTDITVSELISNDEISIVRSDHKIHSVFSTPSSNDSSETSINEATISLISALNCSGNICVNEKHSCKKVKKKASRNNKLPVTSVEYLRKIDNYEGILEDIWRLFDGYYDKACYMLNTYIPHSFSITKLPQKFSLQISPNESGIAFYFDLHGHASKRGCFVYGNYFDDEESQLESMIIPKLMSINSPHFDFEACNFTEKNMYFKDRRDRISKEGSGRVSIYKTIGIIHCYTLECNYNGGRISNFHFGSGSMPHVYFQYYTPAIYEEIGKIIGISVLDYCDINPMSRIKISKYKTLNGVRDRLRIHLHLFKESKFTIKKYNHKSNIKTLSKSLTGMSTTEMNITKSCRANSQSSSLLVKQSNKMHTLPVVRKNSTIDFRSDKTTLPRSGSRTVSFHSFLPKFVNLEFKPIKDHHRKTPENHVLPDSHSNNIEVMSPKSTVSVGRHAKSTLVSAENNS